MGASFTPLISSREARKDFARVNSEDFGRREIRRPGVDPLYDLLFQGLRGERSLFDMFDRMLEMDDVVNAMEGRRINSQDLQEAVKRAEQRRQNFRDVPIERQPLRTETEVIKEERNSQSSASQAQGFGGPKVVKSIPISPYEGTKTAPKLPELQKEETESGYIYTLDTLGVEQGNLNLTLQDNMVIVEGKMMARTDGG